MTADNLPNVSWLKSGSIPTVAVADLKSVWALQNNAVLKALATIPMTGMSPGVMREGFPFDVEELIRLIQTESEV